MSYYVIIPYSYMMRMLYEKEVFLLLVVFGVGTQQWVCKFPAAIQAEAKEFELLLLFATIQ